MHVICIAIVFIWPEIWTTKFLSESWRCELLSCKLLLSLRGLETELASHYRPKTLK